MKNQEIEISVMGEGRVKRKEPMQALVSGQWAIHKPVLWDGRSRETVVTHIPTGLSVLIMPTKKDAIGLMRELQVVPRFDSMAEGKRNGALEQAARIAGHYIKYKVR